MKNRQGTARFLLALGLLCSVPASSVCAAPGDENWDAQFGVPGASDQLTALTFFGGDLIAAGGFTRIGDTDAVRVARFDGTNWHPLRGGFPIVLFSTVRALAVFQNSLYAAGAFTIADGIPVKNIARWDGTNWSACGDGIGGSGLTIVRAMAVAGDRLIVGGTFGTAGGLVTPNVAAWDGTNWMELGGGLPGSAVDSLAASATTIYAGGRFRLAGITNIAMWNGSSWLPLGEGIRGWDVGGGGGGLVRTLLVTENGLVAAGQEFRLAGKTNATNIARWDGSNWWALGAGIDPSGGVHALALNGTDLYAAGFFASAGGTQALGIAKWDGLVWSPLGSGTMYGIDPGSVPGLAATGSELYIGGAFDHAGGKPANNIALWHIPHSLSIERTGDEVLLSWPATGTNFLLEATSDLGAPNWQGVSGTPSILNDQCVVTLALGPGNQFFRLRRK